MLCVMCLRSCSLPLVQYASAIKLVAVPTFLVQVYSRYVHRNIKRLLEILQEEWESSLQTTTASSIAKGKGVAGRTPNSPGVRFSTSPLTDNHRRIRMRLSALLPIEEELMRKLLPDAAAANKDVCVRAGSGWKGILTALTQPSPEALREAIRETRKLTDKPFGVNITLLPSINPPDYPGYAKAAVDEGVRIFETAGNNRML